MNYTKSREIVKIEGIAMMFKKTGNL